MPGFDLLRRPRVVVSLKVQFRRSEASEECWMLDLGMGGTFLQADQEFEVGEWLELLFYVPRHGRLHTVQCCGHVVRVGGKPMEGESYPGVAIEFRKFCRGQGQLRHFLAEQLQRPPHEMGTPPVCTELDFEFRLVPEAGLEFELPVEEKRGSDER
jgi:PilZ domain-containing protein